MKAHLSVLAASLCLTVAFAIPVSAASTKTDTHTAKTSQPTIACNLKGCWPIHKKHTAQKSDTKKTSASTSGTQNGASPNR